MYNFSLLFYLTIVLILTLFMIVNPAETVNAAKSGLELWYSIIVPSLLPFFIVAELLIGMHFAKVLGVLLEPLMRPWFKLPGNSALVIVMGFSSGFPIGAILSRRLWEEKMLTSEEAERLICFTNNCSPLFIIGAVGIGMFANPAIGYLLALSHYLSNIIVGVLGGLRTPAPLFPVQIKQKYWQEAIHTLLLANADNRRGFGNMLGDAVRSSINNLLAVGGFIVIFSVFTRMMLIWGLMDCIAALLTHVTAFFDLSYQSCLGLATGLFEITLGAQAIAVRSPDPLYAKIVLVSIMLAFSGISIIAQVMSVVAGIKVRLSVYLLNRSLQMILSFIFTTIGYYWLLKPDQAVAAISVPFYKILYGFDAWQFSFYCLLGSILIIAVLLMIGVIRQKRQYL